MPNKKRSGASRRKGPAGAKPQTNGQEQPSSPHSGAAFTFNMPSSTTSSAHPSPTPSQGAASNSFSNGHPSKPQPSRASTSGSKKFGVPSSSDEDSDDDSDEEDDDDDEPAASTSAVQQDLTAPEEKDLGNAAFKAGKHRVAVEHYTKAVELDPTEPTYLTNRAAAYMGMGGEGPWKNALQDCLTATAMYKGDVPAKVVVRTVKCQLALALVLEAERTLQQLTPNELDPATFKSYQAEMTKLSNLKRHLGNVQRARDNKEWKMVELGLEEALRGTGVEVQPREWRTWRIQSRVERKKYDEAAALAAELLRDNPNQPEPLYYRGLALYYAANHDQAIKHCQSCLRNDPDFVLARTLMRKIKQLDAIKEAGNVAFKAGQMDEAIKQYTEALDFDPEHGAFRATLFSNRATARMKAGEHDKALEDVESSLQYSSSNYKAHRTKGRIQVAMKDFEAAIRSFETAYEQSPNSSADETALKEEIRVTKIEFKKSKMPKHYETLGIDNSASDTEIKKAYRKASLVHHPDKGGSEEAFKKVGEAYAVLSDPQRRRKFDAGIDENDPESGMGGGFGGGDPFGGGHPFAQFGGGGGFPRGFGGFSSSRGGSSFYDDDDEDDGGHQHYHGGFRFN